MWNVSNLLNISCRSWSIPDRTIFVSFYSNFLKKILMLARFISVSDLNDINIRSERNGIIINFKEEKNNLQMSLKKIGIIFVILVMASCWSTKRMLQKDGFSDPLCAVYDQNTGDCISCICRAFFDKNRQCKPVSDLCQSWNINTGECTSCYRGYELINDTCITIQVFTP